MSEFSRRHLERYLPLLRLQARQMQLNPRLKLLCGDSSDLAHDAMCRALEKFEQFDGGTNEGKLVRWLQEILAHLVVDKMRKHKREAGLVYSLDQVVADSSVRLEKVLRDGQSSPSEQADRGERLMRLSEALDQLPDDQRNVVICRRLHGMRVREIADQLGKTPKSVAMLQYHGEQRLRQLLGGPRSEPQ